MRPAFVHPHLVTFAETNLVGNVYFAHYVSWQGACREAFLAARAPATAARLTDDLALVTVSVTCDFLAELYALDRVEIRMTLESTRENRVVMGFQYHRVGAGPSLLVARGRQEVACMVRTPDGLRPVPVPGELAGALADYADRRA